nr:MAG: baseplate J-like protein [Bacteriophage sp.]
MSDIFAAKTKEEIQQNINNTIKELNPNISIIEGTFKRDLVNANSVEFEKAYTEIDLLKDASFAATSWGDYLTQKCADYGVDRKLAQYAHGKVTFKGTPRAYIPAKTLVQSTNGLQFYTLVDTAIGDNGEIEADIKAQNTGSIYNVEQNTITIIPMSVGGVNSVTNKEAINNGYDTETDDALYTRYYNKMRYPATSGNKYHYSQWATSVNGVGGCVVYPLKHGAGTVEVSIVNSNGEQAAEDLIETVQKYIDSVKPIGATITVVTPELKEITIKLVNAVDGDIELFKTNVQEYFKKQGFTLTKVSKAQIGKLLLNSNYSDYDDILLNDSDSVILDGKLPKLKEVTTNG